MIGDIESATEKFKVAVDTSADPWYSQFSKLAYCYGSISNGQIEGALPLLDQLITFSDENGAEFVGEPARFFLGLTDILNGQVAKGLEVMETLLAQWKATGSRLRVLTCGYVMARVYALLCQGAKQTAEKTDSLQVRQMGDQCIHWFQTCIAEAKEMGAHAMEGQAMMGLGSVHAIMGAVDQARAILIECIEKLKDVNATHHLKEAETLLESLK